MPAAQESKRARFWLALTIFSLVGQIAWVVENMYLNVFIYQMFAASAEQISAMVQASAVCAALTTIFIGALSDKIGKRKIFIAGGYILWGISIIGFSFVRLDIIGGLFPMAASVSAVCITLVIVLDCLMTFFGSSANDACFNAWLTDVTRDSGRGAAEGINAMMPLVAILAVFGGFMGFDLSVPSSWTAIFLIIGISVLIIGIIGLFLIKENTNVSPENNHYFQNIIYGFRPSTARENPTLYITLGIFAVFGIAINIFMPYLILYYDVTLGMKDYVFIMAPAIIIASVVTAFYGRLYDKYGYRRTALPAVAILALGFLLLFLFRNTALVFIGSLLMMCGYLSGMAVFGAMLRDHTPEGKAGMFQGLRIVGQVLLPGVIGPAIGAAVLKNAERVIGDDGTEAFIPNENIFLAALIVTILVLLLLVLQNYLKRRKNH